MAYKRCVYLLLLLFVYKQKPRANLPCVNYLTLKNVCLIFILETKSELHKIVKKEIISKLNITCL